MTIDFIDTHCHLAFPDFSADLAAVKKRAHEAGVSRLVTVGTDLRQSRLNVELASREPTVFATVGIHPHEADQVVSRLGPTLKELKVLARRSKVVAIGETGLDYYKNLSSRANQAKLFLAQIKLALELKKPLVLHIRDAYSDALAILEREYLPLVRLAYPGVAHSFGAGADYARRFMENRFFIGLNGILTFEDGGALRATARVLPLESLLLETDAPFLAPVPFRGRRNEPAYVRLIAQKLAELKNLPLEAVASATTRNAVSLFSLKKSYT